MKDEKGITLIMLMALLVCASIISTVFVIGTNREDTKKVLNSVDEGRENYEKKQNNTIKEQEDITTKWAGVVGDTGIDNEFKPSN